jgi:hypothetical protein
MTRWRLVRFTVAGVALGVAVLAVVSLDPAGLDRADKIASVCALFAALGFGIWGLLRDGRAGAPVPRTAADDAGAVDSTRADGGHVIHGPTGSDEDTTAGAVRCLMHNVPPRLPTFVGRTALLEQVRTALARRDAQPVAVTALYGLGGIGKTQLAVEYAWRYAADYRLVGWLDAEDDALLGDKMAALTGPIGLPVTGKVDVDSAAVLGWLRARDDWLLVYDNATSARDVQRWIPTGRGHVLLTSRSSGWAGLAHKVEVDVLSRLESTALLASRIEGIREDTAARLAAELGDLPLALAQAAGYVEQTGIGPEAYLEHLRNRREHMLVHGSDYRYGARIDTVWALTLQRLQHTAPATAQLLQVAAACGPEPIPMRLFIENAGMLPEPLATAAAGCDPSLTLDEVVGVALSFSVCRRTSEAIQVHRVLQAAVRLSLPPVQRKAIEDVVRQVLVAAHPGDPDDPRTWPAWAQLGPHLLHALTVADLRHHLDIGREVSLFAWSLVARADYAGAYGIAQRLHQLAEQQLGPDAEFTVGAGSNVVTIMRETGDPVTARDLCERQLARCRTTFGERHPTTLHVQNNLVSTLSSLGDLPAARDLAEQALAHCAQTLGDGDHLTLATAGNLASILSDLGDHDQARTLATTTLDRMQALHGDEHRETLWAAAVLINALHEAGDNTSALTLAETSLAHAMVSLGPEHPDTVSLAESRAGLAAASAAPGEEP